MTRPLKYVLLTILSLSSGSLAAESLEEILTFQQAPAGIVIEIIEPDADALKQTLDSVANASQMIRQKFPALPIAIVSHGIEQFSLTLNNMPKHQLLESTVKQLVNDDVDFHVCGTHASWYGITPEEYPDYINVTHAGPAQINDYLKVGYIMLDL